MLSQTCINFFFVLNTKEDILKNVGNQTAAGPHWLWYCEEKILWKSLGTRGGRKKSMHRDSLSNDSGSILSLVFNQMCDDAEFALETPVFCLLPIPHTHTPLEPSVK